MTMIEKMAKAMYLNYANHPDARWDAVDPRMQEGVWRAHARTALAVLLEPSNEMVEVGWRCAGDDIDGRPMWKVASDVAAEYRFRTMIQAALDEK